MLAFIRDIPEGLRSQSPAPILQSRQPLFRMFRSFACLTGRQ